MVVLLIIKRRGEDGGAGEVESAERHKANVFLILPANRTNRTN